MPVQAMDAASYITALYRHLLGRQPDVEGLSTWTALLQQTGDPTAVMAGLLTSAEYRARNVSATPASPTAEAHDGLEGRPIVIVDVGAQALQFEDHVYGPLCTPDIPHRIIGFEPLLGKLDERVRLDKRGDTLTMLPCAIGDGERHVLYINNDDATSSLFPLNPAVCRDYEHLVTLHTVDRVEIETRRLDDVLSPEAVDFLKLDIQGAELMALMGAPGVLSRTAVIHCEVEFAPIYQGQPLYPDVQQLLNAAGFSLIDLIVPHLYAPLTACGTVSQDRLLWADAVFFRDTPGARGLAVQSMVASLVYRKAGIAAQCLERRRKLLDGG